MWTLDNMWIARALFTACVKKTPCSWKQCSYCKDVGLPARTRTSWLNLRPGFHNNITLYTVRHVLLKRRINESEAVSHNSTAPKHLNHAMNPWPNKRDNPAKPSGCIQKRKVSDLAAQTETCRSPSARHAALAAVGRGGISNSRRHPRTKLSRILNKHNKT